MTTAVCYVATSGHLFQTALSAIQAREQTSVAAPTYIVHLVGPEEDGLEGAAFAAVLARHGIELLTLDRAVLGGLSPTFGRFFADFALPDDVDRVLYLDGDTQVVGDLAPLLVAPLAAGCIAACRDPMVLLRRVDRWQASKIGRWWWRSGIPVEIRARYVNSGVLLLERAALPELRRNVRLWAAVRRGLVFPDQDALNLAVGDHISLLSVCWNFPGFLLGTPVERVAPPRIVHFMSRPRPWEAPFHPWGQQFFEPYRVLAEQEPTLAPYWRRSDRVTQARYLAQQEVKMRTERRALMTDRAAGVMRELEADVAAPLGA